MGNKRDAGYKSRKWASYVLTSAAIVFVGWRLHGDPTQVIFGLVSALALYLGGNVSQGWVDAKHGPVATPAAPAVAPPAAAPAAPAPAPAPAAQEEGA